MNIIQNVYPSKPIQNGLSRELVMTLKHENTKNVIDKHENELL